MGLITEGVVSMPYEMAMHDELSRRQYYDHTQSAIRELKEELARLKGHADDMCNELENAVNVEPLPAARAYRRDYPKEGK